MLDVESREVDDESFRDVIKRGEPVKIRNCFFGDCMKNWTLDYLNDKIGSEDVVIHESDETDLNFQNRNFTYKTCKFSQLVTRLESSDRPLLYFRSTNRNPRAKKQARIEDDFPALKNDINPPSWIPYGAQNKLYHSSILRIASERVQIWTHFDLYDNVLCQVVGAKRVILFPPHDTKYLYVEGDKSQVNCFEDWDRCIEKFPNVVKTQPRQCNLESNECLFIPSLWWHNIRSVKLSSEVGLTRHTIGFNIFWRNEDLLRLSQYVGTDVYGNKNLPLYDAALKNLDKAVAHLDKLPPKYRDFHKALLLEQAIKRLLI